MPEGHGFRSNSYRSVVRFAPYSLARRTRALERHEWCVRLPFGSTEQIQKVIVAPQRKSLLVRYSVRLEVKSVQYITELVRNCVHSAFGTAERQPNDAWGKRQKHAISCGFTLRSRVSFYRNSSSRRVPAASHLSLLPEAFPTSATTSRSASVRPIRGRSCVFGPNAQKSSGGHLRRGGFFFRAVHCQ